MGETRKRWAGTGLLRGQTFKRDEAIQIQVSLDVSDSGEIPVYLWVAGEWEGWMSSKGPSGRDLAITFNSPIPSNALTRHLSLCERFVGLEEDAPWPMCTRLAHADDRVATVIVVPAADALTLSLATTLNEAYQYESTGEFGGVLVQALFLDTLERVAQATRIELSPTPIQEERTGLYFTTLHPPSEVLEHGFRALATPLAELFIANLTAGLI